jgi:hypothetical protein
MKTIAVVLSLMIFIPRFTVGFNHPISENLENNLDFFMKKFEKFKFINEQEKLNNTILYKDDKGFAFKSGNFKGDLTLGPTTLKGAGAYFAKCDDAGTILWAQSIQSSKIFGIVTDAKGNVLITGTYKGTTTVGTETLTSNGAEDFFLAKYSTDGILIWVKNGGSQDYDASNGISVDAIGNAYITGYIGSNAVIGDAKIENAGMFVIKYMQDGTRQWIRSADASTFGYAVKADGYGNVYVSGFYKMTARFENFTLRDNGQEDKFVLKISEANKIEWVKKTDDLLIVNKIAEPLVKQ